MPKRTFQWERDAPDDPDEHLPATGEREGRGGKQRKREADAVFALGKRLVSMPAHEWGHLDLSDHLLEQLQIAKDLEERARHRNGYRRQLLAVAGILRKEDHETIAAALEEDVGATPKDRALMDVEYWRSRLLDQGDDGLDELLDAHPGGDRQRLRTLIRQVHKERAKATKAAGPDHQGPLPEGKAFKSLFAALREVMGI